MPLRHGIQLNHCLYWRTIIFGHAIIFLSNSSSTISSNFYWFVCILATVDMIAKISIFVHFCASCQVWYPFLSKKKNLTDFEWIQFAFQTLLSKKTQEKRAHCVNKKTFSSEFFLLFSFRNVEICQIKTVTGTNGHKKRFGASTLKTKLSSCMPISMHCAERGVSQSTFIFGLCAGTRKM